MEKQEFELIYKQTFSDPLIELRFEYVGKTLSLRQVENFGEILIRRLGGKMTRPGSIATMVCFRHTFLRPINSDDPDERIKIISDYPYKLLWSDFENYPSTAVSYVSRNLDHYPLDRFCFEDLPSPLVIEILKGFCEIVSDKIIPWARSRTPEASLGYLETKGEGAWCEMRWIEDYNAYIMNTCGTI